MMTRSPSKTIWVGRIGSKGDQPLVTTDALYCRGVGGHRDTKTLTKLKIFGIFRNFRSKGTRKCFGSKEIPTFCKMNHPKLHLLHKYLSESISNIMIVAV